MGYAAAVASAATTTAASVSRAQRTCTSGWGPRLPQRRRRRTFWLGIAGMSALVLLAGILFTPGGDGRHQRLEPRVPGAAQLSTALDRSKESPAVASRA